MDHQISHNGLYREYEARVATAVRNHQYVEEVRQDSRPAGQAWAGLRSWLVNARNTIERSLQPMEPEGEIA